MDPEKKYSLAYKFKGGLLEFSVQGEARTGESENLQSDVNKIIQKIQPRAVLVDSRKFKGRFGTVDVYHRARKIPAKLMTIPVAMVDLAERSEYLAFFQATMQNAGRIFQWFTDIKQARVWLREMLELREG